MIKLTENIIGHSSTLSIALEQVSRLAPINRPVLIIGERGTGKELIAERTHFLSTRWDKPFLKVNCAAISEQLLESELYGHESGAFTGANRVHHGRFERADGGTLFLDEVGTMSSRVQEKVLRLIEYGEFERLGGQQTLQTDVRVVAATNIDLRQLADANQFRKDLLDRLNFDVIHVPPLRYRLEDIPELAQHFAVQMCRELGWDYFPGFTEAAMQSLYSHTWPGNIRELKNVIERSVYRWTEPSHPVAEIIIDPFLSPYQESEVKAAHPNKTLTAAAPATEPDFTEQMDTFGQQLLQTTLGKYHNHQGRTARALGLTYHQLRGLLRKYNLIGKRRP
ncbi:MAG: phage shock protein operon transcriptional activator [Gammaproteobacteria bacterium]|nr:phage shock protein operon transcriptional activator [Gammaproteobacteria bacterium]